LSLTLREDHRLKAFEKGVLTGIFGPKRNEITGSWENCIMKSFIILVLTEFNHNNQVTKDDMGRACSTHGREGEYI
jgi:hypothetical protein